MCVLETIWETTERHCTKENKCIIKGMIRWNTTKILYISDEKFHS